MIGGPSTGMPKSSSGTILTSTSCSSTTTTVVSSSSASSCAASTTSTSKDTAVGGATSIGSASGELVPEGFAIRSRRGVAATGESSSACFRFSMIVFNRLSDDVNATDCGE